jgi:hypothetical protein
MKKKKKITLKMLKSLLKNIVSLWVYFKMLIGNQIRFTELQDTLWFLESITGSSDRSRDHIKAFFEKK